MARGPADRPWNRPPGLALPVLMSAFAIGASVLGMPPGAAAPPPRVEAAADSPVTAPDPLLGVDGGAPLADLPVPDTAGVVPPSPTPAPAPSPSPAVTAAVPQPTTAEPVAAQGTVVVAGPRSIPAMVLDAYRRAANALARTQPGCRLPWQLLAGIGRIESNHAWSGELAADGTTLRRIIGPALDGGPGMAAVHDTDNGRWDGDTAWDHAVGPMQFLPSTWSVLGRDGGGDGRADPNNVYDATQSAGVYLCAHDRDLSDPADLHAAVFAYNHSDAYVAAVLAWDRAYTTGDVTPSAGSVRGSDVPIAVAQPSPAPVPSSSPRPSRSPEPSASPSASRSASPTPSATPTPSVSPTPSPSPSVSASPVPASCPNLSPSLASASPSLSPSASPTVAPAPSASLMPSSAPALSTSPTPSSSPSASTCTPPPTCPTPSTSPTSSPAGTPSASATPSASLTDVPTGPVDVCPTPSPSPSDTLSPTSSPVQS